MLFCYFLHKILLMCQPNFDMIYATIILLAFTLMAMPLRFNVALTINFDKLIVLIKAKSYGIRVFKEQLFIEDGKLHYQGTLNGTVGKMQKSDAGIGMKLLKSLSFERLYLENCTKLCTPNSAIRATVVDIVFSILGCFTTEQTHCKCKYRSLYTIEEDNTLTTNLQFSVTLLGFAYTLIKEAK